MTPEQKVQNTIEAYLKELYNEGYPVWHDKRQAGGWSYKKGIPDLYGTFNGYHFEVEVKRPGGERRADQEKWEERFKKLNVHYCCCDNIDSFKAWFNLIFLENYKQNL